MSVKIGSTKQLLVDDHIVDHTEGLTRVMHQPDKHPRNPIFRAEMPWEKPSVYLYGTVLRDEPTDPFKMWYQSFTREPEPKGFSCYALSSDGLNWERPELGIFEYQGNTCNNILLDHDVPSVISLPHQPDPQKRYRLFIDGRAINHHGYCTATSPGGLHWTTPRPIFSSGDVAQFCYDPASGLYTTFAKLRAFNAGFLRRSVCTMQTKDPDKWGYPTVTLIPDSEDDRIARQRLEPRQQQVSLWHPETIHTDFYGLSAFPYEGVYIGMLWVFHISSSKVPSDDGLIDVALVCSRNPCDHWDRLGDRQPFIPLGEPGAWDDSMLFTANAPVRIGNELWIYYGGSTMCHGYRPGSRSPEELEAQGKACAIGLAKLRLDGFVSVDAGDEGGSLLTKALVFEGTRLEVNAKADQGELRIELLDAETLQPIPGFLNEEFDPFQDDCVAAQVQTRWRCAPSLSSLAGRPVRLKFQLRNGSLYAFSFRG